MRSKQHIDKYKDQIRFLKKARKLVFYMNNIRILDPSFHKELKFIRDEQTKLLKFSDYVKVNQVLSMIINPAKRPSSS